MKIMKRDRTLFDRLAAWLALSVVICAAGVASAQIPQLQQLQLRGLGRNRPPVPPPVPANAADKPADDVVSNVFLTADRATLQSMNQAKELLEKGRYSEAVRNLGAILESQEDYFFQPSRDRAVHRSLKAEAQRMIGEMPKEGRDVYEASFGDRARAMLSAAVADGNVTEKDGIADVARRFFHTKAGYEATFLLGLNHLDHARPLAAALTLGRLKDVTYLDRQFEPILSLALAASWLQASAPDKAKEVLVEFKNQNPTRQLVIGGNKVPLFTNDAEALDWLVARIGPAPVLAPAETDRWIMFRGDPQRNAASVGSAPLLNLRWEVPTAADPAVEDALQVYYRMKTDNDQPVIPSSHPLVVDDLVLMRTYRNLLALDFATGKRLWDVPVEEAAENTNAAGDINLPLAVPQNSGGNPASVESALAVGRVSGDSLFGTMSSDGRLVYSIEDANTNTVSARAIVLGARQTGGGGYPAVFNYLTARDIRAEGKLRWAIGGPNDQFALPLPETFFLGPPLPLLGQLYVIGETKGEIRLFVLDPDPEKKRDRVLWSQQLAVVERSIQEDPLRRTTGISPSYADGVLVCPTSTGALVAVDLATRSLLWGYRYGREVRDNYQPFVNNPFNNNPYGDDSSRWIESSLTIAGGRVLVASVDSDDLHCLDLATGELQWKTPRGDDLYVACVHQGDVVVIGGKQAHAYRLADGKPAWEGRKVDLPDGALTSGRGFLSEDKYYLPLSTADVAEIDLAAGKIDRMSHSQKGNVPGNLVCYKGRVLSQNYRGLEVFYQLDAALAEVASRLAANPRDAEAFCLRGEILLDSGKRGDAIDCYRKAFEIAAEPRTKLLLRDSLLDGLRTEFAAYRPRSGEIESLLENSPEKAVYLRLMIAGLEKRGEVKDAFGKCQSLIDLDPERMPLEQLSKLQAVRRDRWVQARLAALRSAAKPDVVAEMDAAVAARLNTAESDGSIDAMKTFLAYFGDQPVASQARAALIEKLKKSDRALDAEMSLWQTQPPLTVGIGGPALAEVGEFFRNAQQTEAAAASYRWLASRFADAVCRDGKTGRQLVEAIPPDDPLHKAIERRDPWPTGNVEVGIEASRTAPDFNSYGRVPLEFRGNRGPFFDGLNLVYDQNQNRMKIVCSDPTGNELWQFPLNEDAQLQNQGFAFGRSGMQVQAWGHVLFVPLGNRLAAIDTLEADRAHPPKLLWAEDAGAAQSDVPVRQARVWMNGAFNMAIQRGTRVNQASDTTLVTNRYVAVQRSRTLRVLSPSDGQTFWQREGIPLGSTLFGDDELLFVLPADKVEALVFRAADGEPLGSRKVERREIVERRQDGTKYTWYAPLETECLATLGRNLLYWRQVGDRRTLDLVDVWQQKSLWPVRNFSTKAQCELVNRETLGIFEPNGKFALTSVSDGRTIFESQLQPENNLTDLILIPYEQSYLVLASSPSRIPVTSIQSNPVTGGGDKQIQRGRLYAIDQHGKLLWPEPVKIINQHLVVGQPQNFPALVFASQIYEAQPNRPGKIRMAVQCIDKRTGRTIFDKQDLPQPGYFKVSADPEKKTMQIAVQKNAITLTFTDKPWPTKEEIAKAEAEEKKNKPGKSLFKALKSAAEETFKMPEFENMEDPFGQ